MNRAANVGRRLWAARDSWLVVGLLALSLSLNVYLAWQTRYHSAQARQILGVGAKVPSLAAEQLGGARVVLEWALDGRPTVMYVFTPSCVWCKRNLEGVKVLSKARESSYRFIGVSLSSVGLKEYVEENNLMFPVYTNLDSQTVRRFKLIVTPETLVISRDGKIQKAWPGAYGGTVQKEIEAMFGVHLPHVPSAGSSKAAELQGN